MANWSGIASTTNTGAQSALGGGGGSMWSTVIPAAISALGMLFGNKTQKPQAADQMMTPEMREMLQMQIQRMRGQEPLYNDVMGMARGLLPTRYRGASAPGAGTGGRTPRTDTGAGRGSASGYPFMPGGGPSTHGRDGNGGRFPPEY